MKILYLDLNITYYSPTRSLIPQMLKLNFDITLFGPGYVSDKIFCNGIEKFMEKKDSFDFIISNEMIIFQDFSINNSKSKKKHFGNHYHMFDIDKVQLEKGLITMKNYFFNYTGKKVVLLWETDYYPMTLKHHIEPLKQLDCYYVGFGTQFIENINNLTGLSQETFSNRANNNWKNFINEFNDKIISLPGMVGENEFSFNDLSHKNNSCEVPGAKYHNRELIINILNKNKIKHSKKIFNFIFALVNKFGINLYVKPITMKLYNFLFRELIEKSKYVYTCGSALKYPIRKYFEIPALGSILLCDKCNGFEELGFKDNINSMIIENNIIEKINYLKNNADKAEQIAVNGRNLIFEKHSTFARSKQLFNSLIAIRDNTFNGSYWQDGEFKIKNKKKDNL